MTARINVLVCDRNLIQHRQQLEAKLHDLAQLRWVTCPDDDESLAFLEQTHVFVGARFTEKMAARSPHLKAILVPGAGYEGIDPRAVPSGIPVANTFHHESSIAEYCVAASVMLRRNLLDQDRALRTGRWSSCVYDPQLAQPHSLANAKIGIIGYGHIGQAVWNAFQAFGASGRAIKNSPSTITPDGLAWIGTQRDLSRLMEQSDIAVVCMPLNEKTEGIISHVQLAQLGSQGILINVGRGPIVDEDSLYHALSSHTVGGAAIDVWYHYPGDSGDTYPAHHDFHTLTNILMTPHISGVTYQTFAGRAHDIAANIRHLASDEPLERVVLVGS